MSKDPKYLSLRRKLDELKFTETLHPDSLDLVDRLYKELFKVMNDLQADRRNKPDPQRPPALAALYDQIDTLTARNAHLTQQIAEARSQAPSRDAEEKYLSLNAKLLEFRGKFDEKVEQYENCIDEL
jgi:regulator of replication initiation timing